MDVGVRAFDNERRGGVTHLGLEIALRAGRAMQERVGDRGEPVVKFVGFDHFMHQPEAECIGRGKALAGQPIAQEAALPQGPGQKRRDAERRHAGADLRNGEKRRLGGDRNIATGDDRSAAADRRAMHRRNRRLREPVERGQHVGQ